MAALRAGLGEEARPPRPDATPLRYLRRVASAGLTLLLLSAVVFAGAQVLPGDIGRSMLGPLADPAAVATLNHDLGTDRPAMVIYLDWLAQFVQGDMGQSYAFHTAIAPLVAAALANSVKLAAMAFAIVAPLSIAAGVFAAMRAGRWPDRVIGVAGLSLAVVPEFVSAILLILVFGVWLRWLPLSAAAPPGAGALEQARHLLLPALPLVLLLFGYVSRIARAGTLQALQSDYTRTAVLKGLPWRLVIVRHVLRNGLLPTVTVLATQVGYMLGGLVVVEQLFRYRGIGSLIVGAAKAKDFPLLEAGVLSVGAVYVLMSLVADAVTALLDPRQAERGA